MHKMVQKHSDFCIFSKHQQHYVVVPTKTACLLLTYLKEILLVPCSHGSSCSAYHRLFTNLSLVHHFTQCVMHGESIVGFTYCQDHPKLISLIRINGLEYHIYELFFDISKEFD